MEICDPFEQAFIQATKATCSSTAKITSQEQWDKFTKGLADGGLLADDDRDLMKDIWAEVFKDGTLFQPAGKPRIQLTFDQWRQMLAERIPPDATPALQEIESINQQTEIFNEIVSDWDPNQMTREDTRKLLLVIASMQERRWKLHDRLISKAEEDAYNILLQRSWRLLDDGSLKDVVEERKPTAINHPSRWQFNHIEALERTSRHRRPRKLRYLATRKSGPRGHPIQDDVYGLAQGYNGCHGVSLYRATCQNKESEASGEVEVIVVAVPSLAPFSVTTAQVNAYMAHRELGLAGGVVHCLGKDWSSHDEAFYYYEAVSGVTLASLLRPARGSPIVLHEEGTLFRYWAGKVLRALCELQEQSTHTLLNERLTLDNVVIVGKGLRLRLGGLRWGPPSSPFWSQAEPQLRSRMRKLLRDFGGILQDMLGLDRRSSWHGWYSNMGRVLADEAIERIGHHRALQGLKLHESDEVLLELDSHLRYYTRMEVETVPEPGEAPGKPPAVELDAERDHQREAGEEVYRVRVWGRRPGRGRILLSYEEVEKGGRPEGSPLVLEFQVMPVDVSPRLKAVLQLCQLASGDAPAFTGKAKEYLSLPAWKERTGKLWLQDLQNNPYFKELEADEDLEQIMCEYEATFGGDKATVPKGE